MIALVIKGSPAEARAAMNARQIQWNDSFVALPAGETIGRCSDDELAKITAWYAESVAVPFPPGSLLLYKSLSTTE